MKQPSPYGELAVRLELPPVSQQAKAGSRTTFLAAVRHATKEFEFLFSGDVSVSVEWSIAEKARYETDRAPDVDNILKPLLDALTGPSGVLIDDNQVQHVSCHWIDSYSGAERLAVSLRYSPDEWFAKHGLFFVQLHGGLCVPLSRAAPVTFQRALVAQYQAALDMRAEALSNGIDYYAARACMPVQRVFHRTRLGAFEVTPVETFIAQNSA